MGFYHDLEDLSAGKETSAISVLPGDTLGKMWNFFTTNYQSSSTREKCHGAIKYHSAGHLFQEASIENAAQLVKEQNNLGVRQLMTSTAYGI